MAGPLPPLRGKVAMHAGSELEPELSREEMQAIAFAANDEFARICQRRKEIGKATPPYQPIIRDIS
jgi:hypothetical protein